MLFYQCDQKEMISKNKMKYFYINPVVSVVCVWNQHSFKYDLNLGYFYYLNQVQKSILGFHWVNVLYNIFDKGASMVRCVKKTDQYCYCQVGCGIRD